SLVTRVITQWSARASRSCTMTGWAPRRLRPGYVRCPIMQILATSTLVCRRHYDRADSERTSSETWCDARLSGSSARSCCSVCDRSMGAFLLFRQCRLGRALHDEISFRCRPSGVGARSRPGQSGARALVWAPRRAATRLATFRLLYGARLFHANPGWSYCRPPAGTASHDRHRWPVHGGRPFYDGIRSPFSAGAVDADYWHRRIQAEHLDPGRDAL